MPFTSPFEEYSVRLHAMMLIQAYVPCDHVTTDENKKTITGDKKFAHIAKDYHVDGSTTCGFLCHWLLWRLGCIDEKIVNRTDETRASFKITEQSLTNLKTLTNLKKIDVPGDVLEKLKDLKDQEDKNEEQFLALLKATIGDEQTAKFKSLILKHADTQKWKYRVAQNIECIRIGKRNSDGKSPFVHVFNTNEMQKGERPKFGDIVFIMRDKLTKQEEDVIIAGVDDDIKKNKVMPADRQKQITHRINLKRWRTEHVFIFREEIKIDDETYLWRSADAGQKNSNIQECARFIERTMKLGAKTGAKLGERDLMGWLPLAELTYGPPPVLPPPLDPVLLEQEVLGN